MRRARFGIFLAAVVVAGVFVAGVARSQVPDLLRTRAQEVLEARLQVDATVRSASVGPDRATIGGVTLHRPADGLRVEIDRVSAELDVMALALGGERAVRALRLGNVAVHLPGDPADQAAPGHDGEPEGTEGDPLAEMQRLRRRLESALGRVERATGMLDRQAALHADRISVHAGTRTLATIENARFSMDSTGDRLQLSGEGRSADGGRLDVVVESDRSSGIAGRIAVAELPLGFLPALMPDSPLRRTEQARVDAAIDLAPHPGGGLRVDGSARLRGLTLASPGLGPTPVSIPALSVQGRLLWTPALHRLDFDDADIRIGDASIRLDGSLTRETGRYGADVTAELETLECDRFLASIPPDLIDPFTDFRAAGTLGGTLRLRLDSENLERSVLDFDVVDGCEFVAAPAVAGLERFGEPFEHTVLAADGSLRTLHTGPGTTHWTPISQVSPFLIHAVLAHEDAAFFRHRGFAPWAIRESLEDNLRQGRFVRGASTVTMQLSKNLFLTRDKTVTRKLREALLTWYLEDRWSKARILETYLNVIEFGPDVYGIRSAARHYFGREPIELSPAEAAFLATALPAPSRYHRDFERGELSARTRGEVHFLLRHMARRDRIDVAALEYGLAEAEAARFFRQPGVDVSGPRDVTGRASALPLPETATATLSDTNDESRSDESSLTRESESS